MRFGLGYLFVGLINLQLNLLIQRMDHWKVYIAKPDCKLGCYNTATLYHPPELPAQPVSDIILAIPQPLATFTLIECSTCGMHFQRWTYLSHASASKDTCVHLHHLLETLAYKT